MERHPWSAIRPGGHQTHANGARSARCPRPRHFTEGWTTDGRMTGMGFREKDWSQENIREIRPSVALPIRAIRAFQNSALMAIGEKASGVKGGSSQFLPAEEGKGGSRDRILWKHEAFAEEGCIQIRETRLKTSAPIPHEAICDTPAIKDSQPERKTAQGIENVRQD